MEVPDDHPIFNWMQYQLPLEGYEDNRERPRCGGVPSDTSPQEGEVPLSHLERRDGG